MMFKTSFLALALVASVAAQADVPRPTPVQGERLLGYFVSDTGISFQVTSGGCTTKENFSFTFGRARGPADGIVTTLVLHRNEPDFCEAHLPYGTTLTFSWDELCPRALQCGEIEIRNPRATIRAPRIRTN